MDLLPTLDEAWKRGGFARPASRGLLEHLEGIPPEGISDAIRDASEDAVHRLYRSHFGGEAVPRGDLLHAARRVKAATRRRLGSLRPRL